MYAEEIEGQIKVFVFSKESQKLTLVLHPYLASYFTKGLMSRQMKWYFAYKKWVKVKEDTTIGMVDYFLER